MLDKEYTNRPGRLYWNKLQWWGDVSTLIAGEETAIFRSGFGGHPYNRRPGNYPNQIIIFMHIYIYR